MQSLNPTRIVQRQGRELMIIGAFVLMFGLLTCGCSLIAFLLFSSNVVGFALIALGGIVLLVVLVELARSWHLAPVWFNLCFLGMILPSAWLGGVARARQVVV